MDDECGETTQSEGIEISDASEPTESNDISTSSMQQDIPAEDMSAEDIPADVVSTDDSSEDLQAEDLSADDSASEDAIFPDYPEELPVEDLSSDDVPKEGLREDISSSVQGEDLSANDLPLEDLSEDDQFEACPEDLPAEDLSSDDVPQEDFAEYNSGSLQGEDLSANDLPLEDLSEDDQFEVCPEDLPVEDLSSDDISQEDCKEDFSGSVQGENSSDAEFKEIPVDQRMEEDLSVGDLSSDDASTEDSTINLPADSLIEDYSGTGSEEIPLEQITKEDLSTGDLSSDHASTEDSSKDLPEESSTEDLTVDHAPDSFLGEKSEKDENIETESPEVKNNTKEFDTKADTFDSEKDTILNNAMNDNTNVKNDYIENFLPDIVPLNATNQKMQLLERDDGTQSLVFDHPDFLGDTLDYSQGNNELGLEGDCGLKNTSTWLKVAGSKYGENDVVKYSANNNNIYGEPLCDPNTGGTLPDDRAEIWNHFGMPAEVSRNCSVADLAQSIEDGRAVSVGINAGTLWNTDNPEGHDYLDCMGDGGSNHVIGLMSVSRNPITNEVEGFYVNDTGRSFGRDAARYVPVNCFLEAYKVPRASACISKKPVW